MTTAIDHERATVERIAGDATLILTNRIVPTRHRDHRGLRRRVANVTPALNELAMVDELLSAYDAAGGLKASDDAHAERLLERAKKHAEKALERARALVPTAKEGKA